MRKNKDYGMETVKRAPEKGMNRMMAYQKKYDKLIGKKKSSWRQVRKG